MNKKLLLPLAFGLCAGFFTACGDDNGNNPDNGQISDLSSSSAILPVDPFSSSSEVLGSSASMLPGSSTSLIPGSSASDIVPPVPSEGAPAVPTIGADGFASHWVRSDEGLVTFPENVSVPVDNFADFTYYGAELTGLDQFHYGRFEARMKMVSIPGSVSSMFLYYDDSWKKGDYVWNEIDIEILGKNPGVWQSNLITRHSDEETGKKTSNTTSEAKHQYGFDATADFHLYAMIWTPEYISWEIDSVEVRRDYVGEKKGQVEFMTEEQSLRFNLWAAKSTAWVGKFTGAELADGPKAQWIDYVRVYKYDEATKTFALDWQDDFDGTDLSDHWATGNWEMEHVMLSPSNVVVEDGYCKLLMSRE
ncbi:MAG: glycoside hydrolase family 16 protein [Fibrobacter sp.]|nr:glycoside hydrolase family 16 protein [Fibrobacter sp.]